MPRRNNTPGRSRKQAEALGKVNNSRSRLTRRYAFRMRPHLLRWEAEHMSQREIVALLNEAEAPVPSEYTGAKTRPVATKQWSLVQYQRFRKLADAAHEAMVWYARKHGKSHVQPYGDGAGLFGNPLTAGLAYDPNRPGAAQVLPPCTPSHAEPSEDPEAMLERIRQIDDNFAVHFPLASADQVRYQEIVEEERHRAARSGAGTIPKDAQQAAVRRALFRQQDERAVKMSNPTYRRRWNREQAELLRLLEEEALAKSLLLELKRARGELPPPPPLPEIDEDGWREDMKDYWERKMGPL